MRSLRRLAFTASLLSACGSHAPTGSPDGGKGTGMNGGGGTAAGDGGAAAYPSGDLAGEDCDPMVAEECGFPFPSNVYLVDDPSTPTGKRVHFSATMLPLALGRRGSPAAWNDSDGFSPGQAPLTLLPGATTQGLPTQDDIGASLDPGCPTVLLDTSTDPPSRVPHFAELDVYGKTPSDQTFLIRPAVRLKDATRYLVAIRDVRGADGNPLPPSPVFQALRDGASSSDPTVASRRALYDDIFAKLSAAGVEKGNLQIAWDYTTASRQNDTGQLLSMRDQALAAVGGAGPSYTIRSHEENPDPYTARVIEGTMHAPLFMDHAQVLPGFGGETPAPVTGFLLQRDAQGKPRQNGFGDFEFTVTIPKSVAAGTAPLPAPILTQGHGLFGNRYEGLGGNYLSRLANQYGYVTVTVDLVGWMNNANQDPVWEDDGVAAAEFVMAGDPGLFRRMVDRGTQGIVNELLAVRLLKGSFAQDPLVQYGGRPVIDTAHAYWRGDSQGGILGTTFMAVATDVTRGYLGEPGLPYDLLLMRSVDFGTSLSLMQGTYSNARDIQLVLGLMQMFWDRLEGDGFAPYIASDMLPGTPAHQILIQDAIGDFQVTPLGAHLLARAVGAVHLTPAPRPIFGLTDAPGPVAGSAIQEYDFGLLSMPGVTVPETDAPPSYDGDGGDPDPHDRVRQTLSAFQATDTFFRTGVAQNFCTDPDGGAGACVYKE